MALVAERYSPSPNRNYAMLGKPPEPQQASQIYLCHEAASRLFEKGLNVMEAASVTGHKTLSMLKRYTHLNPTDIAKKLG